MPIKEGHYSLDELQDAANKQLTEEEREEGEWAEVYKKIKAEISRNNLAPQKLKVHRTEPIYDERANVVGYRDKDDNPHMDHGK